MSLLGYLRQRYELQTLITSSMLYALALTPESPKHFQSFLPFLAASPLLLLEERGRSRSGKLGWRLKGLQIHWSIQLYLSSPLIPNISTVSIYVRLSGWSSLYKTKRSIEQTRGERFCLKNVTMKKMPLARNDDIIVSTSSLFTILFSFYTLIISYIPTRSHDNVVISTKSLFRI